MRWQWGAMKENRMCARVVAMARATHLEHGVVHSARAPHSEAQFVERHAPIPILIDELNNVSNLVVVQH